MHYTNVGSGNLTMGPCSACSCIQGEARAWRSHFFIECFLQVLLIIALLLTVCYWKDQIPSISPESIEHLQHLCLECQDVSVHPIDDEDQLKDLKRNGSDEKCCTKDSSHVKHLVHQFLERNRRISWATKGFAISKCPDYENGKKPAGRVVGVDPGQTDIDNEERHVLRWLNTEEGSYQNPGVTFTDGQLEITTSGYYWFNSRVTFRDASTTFAQDRFVFFHNIFRRSAEYPLREDWKLVEAGKTLCKLQSGFTDRSSYIGDIAYFKKGERIIVKVSHPDMVSQTPYDSFLEVRLY